MNLRYENIYGILILHSIWYILEQEREIPF